MLIFIYLKKNIHANVYLIILKYGTLLFRFRAYKAQSGERFFQCGISKDAVEKPKAINQYIRGTHNYYLD